MAGTTGAILNSAFNLGSAVGLAVFNSIQTSVDAKHGGPTSFAGRAAGFWFIFTLLCVEAISLIVFYRIEAEKPDRHDEETNESEVSQPVEEIPVNTKVSNEKLSELQIPNV